MSAQAVKGHINTITQSLLSLNKQGPIIESQSYKTTCQATANPEKHHHFRQSTLYLLATTF